MSRIFTEDEVMLAVRELTRGRLLTWVEAEIVLPLEEDDGWRFREVDVARLQTLVDLDEGFDLPGDSLKMVMGLIDQLNTIRTEMDRLMAALAAEPDEVRLRLRSVLTQG